MKITYLPEDGKNFVEYEIRRNTIDFNDGELAFNIAKKERDYKVVVDICMDYTKSLVIGAGSGHSYVAQVIIPERQYTEVPVEGSEEQTTTLEPVPFDIDRCELVLWEMEE